MLVLSRKQDQEITFPELDVKIRVLKVGGRNVRLGISAPEDVFVLRGELADFKDQNSYGQVTELEYDFEFETNPVTVEQVPAA